MMAGSKTVNLFGLRYAYSVYRVFLSLWPGPGPVCVCVCECVLLLLLVLLLVLLLLLTCHGLLHGVSAYTHRTCMMLAILAVAQVHLNK